MLRRPRLPKNKKFDYQPRFYDPDKEDLSKRQRWAEAEERLRKLEEKEKKEEELDNYNQDNSILKGSFGRAKDKRKTVFGNMSILVLLVLLGASAYIFYNLGSGGKDMGWQVYTILLLVPVYIFFRIRANAKVKK